MPHDFTPFERLLGGFDTDLELSSSPVQRATRAMLESHLISKKDVGGCFAYVGWPRIAPKSEVQFQVHGFFARAAVATKVFVGALEPNEGFGLVIWGSDPGFSEGYLSARTQMEQALNYASGLLQTRLPDAQADLSVTIGCGRLRGDAHLANDSAVKRDPLYALDGPTIVETFYGEIPNRCGATAKGKETKPAAIPFLGEKGRHPYNLFQQPWTRLFGQEHLTKQKLADASRLGRDPEAVKHNLLTEICHTTQADIPLDALQPYLVGISLDFAQSRDAYMANSHRARAVVDHILKEFNTLATGPDSIPMFVSPRYGDGVAAIIAVQDTSIGRVKHGAWSEALRKFADRSTDALQDSGGLGLRIGMALDVDSLAYSPRLAGMGAVSCGAVEALNTSVIAAARKCHPIAKKKAETDPQFAAIHRAVVFESDNDAVNVWFQGTAGRQVPSA